MFTFLQPGRVASAQLSGVPGARAELRPLPLRRSAVLRREGSGAPAAGAPRRVRAAAGAGGRGAPGAAFAWGARAGSTERAAKSRSANGISNEYVTYPRPSSRNESTAMVAPVAGPVAAAQANALAATLVLLASATIWQLAVPHAAPVAAVLAAQGR